MLLKSPHPFLTDTLSFILQLRLIPSYGFGQLALGILKLIYMKLLHAIVHIPQSSVHSVKTCKKYVNHDLNQSRWGEFKPWKIEERSDMRLTFEEYLEKNMSFVFSFKDAETTILCKSFNVSKLLR